MGAIGLMCIILATCIMLGTLVWAVLHGIPALFNLILRIITHVLVGIIRVVIEVRAALHENASHSR